MKAGGCAHGLKVQLSATSCSFNCTEEAWDGSASVTHLIMEAMESAIYTETMDQLQHTSKKALLPGHLFLLLKVSHTADTEAVPSAGRGGLHLCTERGSGTREMAWHERKTTMHQSITSHGTVSHSIEENSAQKSVTVLCHWG